jgi:hypothetical protein
MAAKTFSRDDGTGFFTEAQGTEVRRQLRMSVGIVVVLAFGIVSAAATVGSHPLEAKRAMTSAPLTTLHAETNAVGAKPI